MYAWTASPRMGSLWPKSRTWTWALGSMGISVLDLLELLEQRFDAHRHLAPRDLPLPLLALEAPVLRSQGGVMPAQPVLQLPHVPRQLVALHLETIAVGAQLLDHPGGPLDAVRQSVDIRKSGGGG